MLFELDETKIGQYQKDKDLFRHQYILDKKYALLLGINGERMNIFEILAQNVGQGTKWKRRIKASTSKILGADSLKIAQLIMQMPTGGELDYAYDRKALLYFSLEERKSILKAISEGKAYDEI